MKKFYPKVSILIPVYNGSNYLKEAIDSAIAQTYKNIEIIIVNDGSNDKGATEKIAKSYGNKIKYYSKENGGVATALNYGIKKMTGDYFSWLSHDDMYYPYKIEKQVNFLKATKDKKIVLYSNYALLIEGRITPVINHHEMLVRKKKYSLLRGAVNGITLMIPKSIIDEMGFFKENLRCTQDYDYWIRIQKKYDFVHMEDILSVTRIHGKQDSIVSPSVISEGNKLWLNMIKSLSNEEKKEYEGTLYNFYFEMTKFLKGTPYDEALAFCNNEKSRLVIDTATHKPNYKVSVIIPFYNRPDQTINSIKSVLSQTYKNTEIVLVNDTSTDDISAVTNFIRNYPNIILINAKINKGAGAARNLGIKAATGEYIAFLDSDDEFKENKLKLQLSEMLKHNPDISYTSYIKRSGGFETIMSGHDISGVVVPRMISSCPIATPTVMIRRKLLIDEGIFFNESIRIGEDTCFWLELAKKHEIFLIENPLTIVHADETSSAYSYDKVTEGICNIIAYLTNDPYYSKFRYDISLLCNDFHAIYKNIQKLNDDNLKINNYYVPSIGQLAMSAVRRTIVYRLTRKLYKDGPRATYIAAIKKLSGV